MDLDDATASGAVGESALGTAIVLTPSRLASGSCTRAVCLVADSAGLITIVIGGALQGGVLALAKSMVAHAALNVAILLFCLEISAIEAAELLTLSTSPTGFVGGSAPLGLPRLTASRGFGFGRGRDLGSTGSSTESAPAPPCGVGHHNALLFDTAMNPSGVERASRRIAALQSFVDTGELGAGLGGVRRSSFFASVLSKLGMPEVTLLGAPFRQAQALAMSGADAEADLRLANCDGCLGLLPAAAVPEILADIGQRFCRLTGFVSTGAIRADRLVRALSARPVPTTAFVKSTA